MPYVIVAFACYTKSMKMSLIVDAEWICFGIKNTETSFRTNNRCKIDTSICKYTSDYNYIYMYNTHT